MARSTRSTRVRDTDAFVQVRGARENNLKNVDLDIPRDALVAFTGISGSGKSSLAFGTLFAEAQRRYLESISPYARRLIDQAGIPDVDSIAGLPPAVARSSSAAPRARAPRSAASPPSPIHCECFIPARVPTRVARKSSMRTGSRRTRPPAHAPPATGWAGSTTPPRRRWCLIGP